MIDDKILSKIRKTISLAQDKSNLDESSAAWNRVKEMLKKYDLTIEEVYKRRKVKRKLPHSKKVLSLSGDLLPINIKETEKHSWFHIPFHLRIEYEPKTTFQIVPDQTVMSGRSVESLLNTFHSVYENILDRFWIEQRTFVFKMQESVSFQILYKKDKIVFYLTFPSKYEKIITNSVNNIWPKSALVRVEEREMFDYDKSECATLELKEHFFKSILVDRTQNVPIPSLMASGRNIEDNDKALLDVCFTPVGDKWREHARSAKMKARRDIVVKKRPNSLTEVLFVIGDFVSDSIVEKIFDFMDIMVGNEKPKRKENYFLDEYREMRRESRRFNPSTEQKSEYNGFDVMIRIVSESEQRQRANLTLQAIGTSFKDLNADNEFEVKRVKNSKRFINQVQNNRRPLLRINGNILSIPECSQILQLPTGAIQEEYPEIEHIDTLEVDADPLLLDGGMLLGEVSIKKTSKQVYQPVKNKNDFCRTMIIEGGQGQGKTKGFLANLLIEAYLKGFGALAIDAAKKEISSEIECAVKKGIVKKEDFVHIDAGKIAMSLDWKEALLDFEDGKSRLASTAIDFFKITEDTTGQTGRFLRALILCMETGKLVELIELMEDVDLLQKRMSRLQGLPQKTIMSFLKMSESQRRQVIAPIYNRLDLIMGDSYLARCLESDYEINMIDIMSQKKIFVFDFSDEDLLPSQQDVCINLLFTKIDLAMRMRKKIKGREFEFPFFIACDEPAKYLKSANIWEAMTVQGRKWRVAFAWAFHYWTQLPRGFQDAIKASLPHYFFYPTSKDQWRAFLEEIQPFTLEHAMKLKAFHAINVIYTEDGYLKPIVVKMAAPPSMRFRRDTCG